MRAPVKIRIRKIVSHAIYKQYKKDEDRFRKRLNTEITLLQTQHKEDIKYETDKINRDYQAKMERLNNRIKNIEQERDRYIDQYNKVLNYKIDMIKARDHLSPLLEQFMGLCGSIRNNLNKIDLIEYRMKNKKDGVKE